MSWGAICWMPDLRLWARIVRDHLRPGGFLILFEHHPVWEVLASLADAGLITSHFSEGPDARLYAGLGNQADWLPAYYAIKASRPPAGGHLSVRHTAGSWAVIARGGPSA